MTDTQLNAELVEKFGELERLLGQIYGQQHGVTCYIDEMTEKTSIFSAKIHEWNIVLKRLKDVRHKRNNLSHGEVSFSEDYAEQADIDFVKDFKLKILKSADPLSLCRKLGVQRKRPSLNSSGAYKIKESTYKKAKNFIICAVLAVSIVLILLLMIFTLTQGM